MPDFIGFLVHWWIIVTLAAFAIAVVAHLVGLVTMDRDD